MKLSLESQIEALLFWKAEPVSIKKLASLLKKEVSEVTTAVTNLQEQLKNRGLTLVQWEDEVTLGTSSHVSELIESLTKEELTKAAAEMQLL